MEMHYIKNYTVEGIKKDSFESTVAKLYVFLLPVRMISQLSFLRNIFGICAFYLPFLFHVIGLLLWIKNENGKLEFGDKTDLIQTAGRLLIWLNASSLFMAIIIQVLYGNHGTENAFRGIAGMVVYFTQYFLMFAYNYRVFKLLSFREINNQLHKSCLLLLVIGYSQVLVMNGIGAGVYNRLNVLGIMNNASHLPKLCLTGNEGATAGCIMGVFVLPFLFSQIIAGKRLYIVEIVLWLIPVFYSYSSTAYILVAIDFVFLGIFLTLYTKDPQRGLLSFLLMILIIGFYILILINLDILTQDQIYSIKYLLLAKATDNGNQSTIQRTVPLLVNWGAFKEYPLLGVGNGLQGYFYEKYLPKWMLRAGGYYMGVFLERSRQGISNGGVFIPSLLSGYGIIGCLFICAFMWKCVKENGKNRLFIGNFYYLYIISGISFFIVGFTGEMCGMYFAWFMLSIPFMSTKALDNSDKYLKESLTKNVFFR